MRNMRWGRKSEASEFYCAIHNVDCPYHGADGDAWVIITNPGYIPTAWICPHSVLELSEFYGRAEEEANMYDREQEFMM
jgi:hypothetical protein